ncbi:MAG TPA: acyltransferase [Puia sp.]|jgi:acetyltransferase-like isoleucine patch superfamily enzyme|nr:acyltransferase [Puia sp.]
MAILRTISRKLRSLAGGGAGPQYRSLLKQGVLRTGNGCDLHSMQVILVGVTPGTLVIEMGNNCCVRGTIMVYRPTSKVVLGDNVYIGPGSWIECSVGVTIGSNVLISMNCHIIDTNSHSLNSAHRLEDTIEWQKGLSYKDWSKVQCAPVSIGDKCWVGLRSIILKGVSLGEGSIVAAGSVVTNAVQPYTIVGGNPASFIKATE